jgi:hypothetical protein
MTRNQDFAFAIYMLQHGERVAREGWRDQYIFLFRDGTQHRVHSAPLRALTNFRDPMSPVCAAVERFNLEPYICMRTFDRKFLPWVPTQADILADDWTKVEPC